MERRKYTNYRYLNYIAEGVAELKLSPKLEHARNINIEKKSTIPNIAQGKLLSYTKFSEKENLNSRSKSTKEKNTYKDKPLRTTANFIGKPYYNVGYRRNCLLKLSLRRRKISYEKV